MIRKFLLALVLTLVGNVTASAQEYQYIGIQGSWWNHEYAGEGFSVEEYGDGFVIAYWYTFNSMGEQLWLIGNGERDGNTVVLEMLKASGGAMADPANPENVQEEVWGTVTLTINDCTHMDMTFESLEGDVGGYSITRLVPRPLAAGSCSAIFIDAPEPPPETDPPEEEEEPPEPEETSTIRLQKRGPTGLWEDIEYPFTGLSVIHKTYLGDPDRISLFSFRVIAEEGNMVIGNISTSEPTGIAQPSVEGIRPGMSFPEGSVIGFTLDSNLTGGQRVYPYYNVHIEGVGEIVNLTVRLSTQTL